VPSTAYVGLGSNLGDRAAHLARALGALPPRGLVVAAVSAIYETEPVGGPAQGPYLNAVARVETALPPAEAMAALLAVEKDFGRVRTVANAPRVIDLDLLLHGDAVVREPGLTVPHPRLHERRFVLRPLADVGAAARHPVLGLTVAELLALCPDRAAVERWAAAPDPGA
jgi:2-amino-4-hydroxy-6-hydroxymethyldihydropteridine diphosphokinase